MTIRRLALKDKGIKEKAGGLVGALKFSGIIAYLNSDFLCYDILE